MKKLLGTILLAGLIVLPIMSMAQVNAPVPPPPPIPFVGPPNVVVLPGTDVYAVPDVKEDVYFRRGWWWRHHGDHWYRSKYHDQGWAYYRGYPSWHRKIPHDWRDRYSNHTWGGRPWNPHYIHQGDLNRHWRGGHWRTDHGWGPPGGGRKLHGDTQGKRTHPDGRMKKSQTKSAHPDGRMNKSHDGGSHRDDRR